MKSTHAVLLVCGLFAFASQAQAKTILPDACGDDSTKFEVTALKDAPPPAPPADGKAQIVFIEDENQGLGFGMHATIRYGVDGTWAGANNGNTFFIMNVDPGVHHLCVSWQSALKTLKKSIDVASFTAEAGKVYYYAAEIRITVVRGAYGPGVTSGGGGANIDFGLAPLGEDEGKYRVKAWKLSTWKTK
ncbi:MAG: hypothetical protein ABR976_11410 [Terracidiphilus sp.]|jgi:hypothetical protein